MISLKCTPPLALCEGVKVAELPSDEGQGCSPEGLELSFFCKVVSFLGSSAISVIGSEFLSSTLRAASLLELRNHSVELAGPVVSRQKRRGHDARPPHFLSRKDFNLPFWRNRIGCGRVSECLYLTCFSRFPSSKTTQEHNSLQLG